MIDGWKLVTGNVEIFDKLMYLFKEFQTQFGLDPLLMVPTSGTGAIRSNPCTTSGEDYWDADIANFKGVLINIHALSLDQVQAWYGQFMDRESQYIWINNGMMIKAI